MARIKLPNRIFVTGTDTGVGKTIISSILVNGLKADYWKPIQTGDDSDKDLIKKITLFSKKKLIDEAYRLKAPLSPYSSAKNENIRLDINHILRCYKEIKARCLVVEGAGGVFVPVLKNYFISDLIKSLGLSCVIVARSGLGTINHTLLTIEHLQRKHINILCVVLNGKRDLLNEDIIEKISGVRVVGIENIDLDEKDNLIREFNNSFI